MTRIYLEQPLQPQAELVLPDAAARHVAQVLRMRLGESLHLFDGSGAEYEASIVAIDRRSVRVALGEAVQIDRESPLRLCLAQCVSKGERMDYAIQKAVELGVTQIVPLLSARSVVRLDEERWEKKLEHWRGVVIAACEQSGRTRLPVLAPLAKLDRWLAAPPQGLRLVLAPGGHRRLRALPAAEMVSLLVGPEGGLDEQELVLAQRAGFERLGLGPRVLRTETAGVAALAALQVLWGDAG